MANHLNIHEVQTLIVYAQKLVDENDQLSASRRQELSWRVDSDTYEKFIDACHTILQTGPKIEGVDVKV
jgi:hypothetical protein